MSFSPALRHLFQQHAHAPPCIAYFIRDAIRYNAQAPNTPTRHIPTMCRATARVVSRAKDCGGGRRGSGTASWLCRVDKFAVGASDGGVESGEIDRGSNAAMGKQKIWSRASIEKDRVRNNGAEGTRENCRKWKRRGVSNTSPFFCKDILVDFALHSGYNCAVKAKLFVKALR